MKLGGKISDKWLVEEGLGATDRVVVEGSDKVRQGTDLQVTMGTIGYTDSGQGIGGNVMANFLLTVPFLLSYCQ